MTVDDEKYRLIADIGGTHARFALVDEKGAIVDEEVLETAAYDGPEVAAAGFLRGRVPGDAVVAVATPVSGDRIALTNSDWSFSHQALRQALDVDELHVINDFVAQALAVPHLEPSDLVPLGPHPTTAISGLHADSRQSGPVAVLGPGTGLGVAGLLALDRGWMPLASEGGHVSFAPNDAREDAVLHRLRHSFAHVSNERLISGPGLLHIAGSLAAIDGARLEIEGPDEITDRARRGDCPICAEAVRMFAALLGAAAGDVALTLGARAGVFICGGVARAMRDLIDPALLRERFLAKGRLRSFLEPIPLFLVVHPQPGLLGTIRFRPPAGT